MQTNHLQGWTLNVDGASNNEGAGVSIILATPDGFIFVQSYTLVFPATNNEAEYEVDIAGLKMAAILGVSRLEVCCDSLWW